MTELMEKVVNCITKVSGYSAEIKETTTMDELNIDELGAIELLVYLEEDLNIVIPDDAEEGWFIVKDVYDTVAQCLPNEGRKPRLCKCGIALKESEDKYCAECE